MIVLKELNTSQTFKIIPRYYVADRMELTNETTGETLSYDITITQTDYYAVISKIVTLKENNYYHLTVYDGTDIVYKDKVFCTNQTVETYSVNNNEYTNVTTDNDFIIYE